MAEIILGLLKFGLMILALALIPISLVVATPFILVWPRPIDGRSWGQIIRGRYGRVLNGVLQLSAGKPHSNKSSFPRRRKSSPHDFHRTPPGSPRWEQRLAQLPLTYHPPNRIPVISTY